MRRVVFLATAVAALTAAGRTIPSPAPSHITLDRNAEPLKSRFNADVGKTRIVMLVAPT